MELAWVAVAGAFLVASNIKKTTGMGGMTVSPSEAGSPRCWWLLVETT